MDKGLLLKDDEELAMHSVPEDISSECNIAVTGDISNIEERISNQD